MPFALLNADVPVKVFAVPAIAPTEALTPATDKPVESALPPIDSIAAFASASVVALAAADTPCAMPTAPFTTPVAQSAPPITGPTTGIKHAAAVTALLRVCPKLKFPFSSQNSPLTPFTTPLTAPDIALPIVSKKS